MTTVRRSARIARRDRTPSPPPALASAPAPAPEPEPSDETENVEAPTVNTVPLGEETNSGDERKSTAEPEPFPMRARKAKARFQPNPDSKNWLFALPPEILDMALSGIKEPASMSALAQTCKAFYSIMTPQLYRRLGVVAHYHATIPKLIRAVEPHLTIAQKKQLKREGKYKGQQARYPTGLDEHAKPFCSSYVREMAIGRSDPGRKHIYIVQRYIEELLKNVDKLEGLDTYMMTRLAAERIASLPNLKSLRLNVDSWDEDSEPLAGVKNLKHLSFVSYGYGSYRGAHHNCLQFILQNSAATLESLAVEASYMDSETGLLTHWRDLAHGNPVLRSLKSLELNSHSKLGSNVIRSLTRAIDFTTLTDLKFGYFCGSNVMLLRILVILSRTAASQGRSGMSLRRFTVAMGHSYPASADIVTAAELSEVTDALSQFIDSFDALEALELQEYAHYSQHTRTNPDLPDVLLQAILKHKNLKSLKISYRGKGRDGVMPWLSVATVRRIVDGLPRLRVFAFPLDETRTDATSLSLARGANLTFITCYPRVSYGDFLQRSDHGMRILASIIKTRLDKPELFSNPGWGASGGDPFIWERHCNLKKVSVSFKTWEIASKFIGEGARGTGSAELFPSNDGRRQVYYRDITRVLATGDVSFEWLEQVAED